MTKKLLLLLLYLVFFLSTITVGLILLYIDPYMSNDFVIVSLLVSLILSISSILTAVLYFIKKVHYRWQVLSSHLNASMRQAFFVVAFLFGIAFFIRLEVPFYISSLLLLIFLVFSELLIQNVIS